MSEAKKEILKRIRNAQKLSHAPAPGTVKVSRNYLTGTTLPTGELREMLIDRLVDYHAEVVRTSSQDLPSAIAKVISGRECTSVCYAPGLSTDLLSHLDATVTTFPDDSDTNPRSLDKVDAVLTDSHVSCAVTGTICLQSSPTNGRRALTLVPDRHICIVRMDTVVHGVPEMISTLDPERPITMISGPSATSDIELQRVEGVHGPRDLIVILVD